MDGWTQLYRMIHWSFKQHIELFHLFRRERFYKSIDNFGLKTVAFITRRSNYGEQVSFLNDSQSPSCLAIGCPITVELELRVDLTRGH